MLPKVIIYNSVSLDGAIKDFNINIQLHYMIAGKFAADTFLVGSTTAKTGIEIFMKNVPPEEPSDYYKPKIAPNDNRPIWVIADSKGILQGLMHINRRSEYTKNVIVLISSSTPKAYVDYLRERNYDFIIAGKKHVDLKLALEELNKLYDAKTVLTDSGGVLASVLLEQNLVDEVQLLVAPEIVGKKSMNLFRSLNKAVKVELKNAEIVEKSYVLLSYKVVKN